MGWRWRSHWRSAGTWGAGYVGINYLGWWGAAEAAGTAATAACADDGCAGEVRAATTAVNQVAQAVQRGLSAVRNGIGRGYNSHSSMVYHEGPAGPGKAWHHIVNQTPTNIQRFGARVIHNTNNLIKLPHGGETIHQKISNHYRSSIPQITGTSNLRVSQWLETKSFEFQWKYGIELLQELGGEQYIIEQIGR